MVQKAIELVTKWLPTIRPYKQNGRVLCACSALSQNITRVLLLFDFFGIFSPHLHTHTQTVTRSHRNEIRNYYGGME